MVVSSLGALFRWILHLFPHSGIKTGSSDSVFFRFTQLAFVFRATKHGDEGIVNGVNESTTPAGNGQNGLAHSKGNAKMITMMLRLALKAKASRFLAILFV
mmetsp:Transcript_3328/g.5049  ORF Transcript_3328/g.5049 Transcript_3328/m.5049 type:complete len:101 (+) Transcript_3328:1689-1991(+)